MPTVLTVQQPLSVSTRRGSEQAAVDTAPAATSTTLALATKMASDEEPVDSVSMRTIQDQAPIDQEEIAVIDAEIEPVQTQQKQPQPQQSQGSRCLLRGHEIDCGSNYYQLALNRPKHALPTSAFSAGNQLDLPPFMGDIQDEHAVREYLHRAYETYIEKMVGLGLAGSTMSFTAFYRGFRDQAERYVDFAGRFRKMFEFLKADRQKLAVSTRAPGDLPQSLGQCATLSNNVIVCDDLKQNWVYVRQ